MLQYKEFIDLTDEEIEFILKDIFHPTNVRNIKRDVEYNEITADITTSWNDGKEDLDVTDEITLTPEKIVVDFSLAKDDLLKWKQFLLAKGCDYRLKDNPYI